MKKEPLWCDVGIIKGTSFVVKSYFDPSFIEDTDHPDITVDNLPDFVNVKSIELEPGTAYKFRVAAINTCGRGPWSEVSFSYRSTSEHAQHCLGNKVKAYYNTRAPLS